MTKVLFVQNLWVEYYGVMVLSSVLKKHGHECDLIIGNTSDIKKRVKSYNPDIVAFSAMHIQNDWFNDTSKLIKNISKAKIFVGGAIVFSEKDLAKKKYIDILCVGEGEKAILEIANKLEKKERIENVKNIMINKKGTVIINEVGDAVYNLNTLPFPDREIYRQYPYFQKNTRYETVIASRGCTYKCTFCFYDTTKREGLIPDGIRQRAPRNVIEEIKSALRDKKSNLISFLDSIFIINKHWVKKFLKLYRKEVDIPFNCNGHFNYLNEEIIIELKKSKCVNLLMGIESGDEEYRNTVLDKHIKDKTIFEKAKLLHKHKQPFLTLNMMALPGETFEQAMKTIRINQKIKPRCLFVEMLMLYPNLGLTNYAIENNYLRQENFELLSKGSHKLMKSILTQPDIDKVSNLQKFAILLVHNPRLEPVIMQLIKLPQNRGFELMFAFIAYIEMIRQFKFSIFRIFEDTIKNFKSLY